MNNIDKGKSGEAIAKDYLVSKGYNILQTNYRNKIGEIDIIAMDGNILVFIEVKTRTSLKYGYAYEAVNINKQKKIINTSILFVKYNKYVDTQLRYDIIEVYLQNSIKINHIVDAYCI